MRNSLRVILLATVTLASVACGDGSDLSFEPASVVVEVDFSARRHRVGKLIGWNIGAGTRYSPLSGGRHPEWRTPETQEMISRLSQVRPANGDRPIVRFSGLQVDGAIGLDGYHFFDFADPTSPPSPEDNVAPFEYMAIIEEADADPLVMLNFGSGTASEAANYARHLTGTDSADPFVQARGAFGPEEPWPVTNYEIGNEIYEPFNTGYSATGAHSYANPDAVHGGDPEWYGRPAANVDDYAARAISYIDEVLNVQPEARFYIPLTQSTWTGWGGPEQSIPRLAALLQRPSVKGVVVHQYIIDDGQNGHGWAMAEDGWLLSSSALYGPLYSDLRELLSTLPREEPLELVVTEYLGSALQTLGRRYAADLAVVDMLMMYASTGVDLALEHMTLAPDPEASPIVRDWHKPFFVENGEVKSRPNYTLTSLFAEHLWHHVATVRPRLMPTADQPLDGGGYQYDSVHTLALVSEDDRSASVLLLNRDLNETRRVELALQAGERVVNARSIAPEEIWIDTLTETAEIASIRYVQVGARVSIELPPHSFTAVSIVR